MAKTQASEYIDRGFTQEMFRKKTAFELTEFIAGVIDEQAGLLEGRIGAGIYATTDALQAKAVARAERLWVLAELLAIRIDMVLGEVDGGGGMDNFKLRRNRGSYLEEAETLITRLCNGFTVPGADADYAGAVVESEHDGTMVAP